MKKPRGNSFRKNEECKRRMTRRDISTSGYIIEVVGLVEGILARGTMGKGTYHARLEQSQEEEIREIVLT